MKKIILYLTIIVAIFSFCSCGHKNNDDIEITGMNENITNADDITGKEESNIPPAYREILESYKKAGQEKWDAEKLIEKGHSYLYKNLYEGDPLENIGYYINDINGDGRLELLIVPVNTSFDGYDNILDLYTLKDGKAALVLQGGERNAYYLTKDGNISNVGSASAAQTAYYLYELKNSNILLKEGIIFDAAFDQANPWFLTSDEDFDASNDTPVSEDEAMKKIQEYEDNYAGIPWTILKNYK